MTEEICLRVLIRKKIAADIFTRAIVVYVTKLITIGHTARIKSVIR
jgi:hypothetical protein